ncbi:hypothetical protein AB0C96_18560 [Streptomyces sp. NPDC048506]|uniref:hypothetical protein n=1 Tax=Streptomyces sp. NPDC048506 TaxID=3155028 RepID=UPI0034157930
MTYRAWSEKWESVRPGWRALSKWNDRAEAKMRFRGVQPFSLGGYAFDHAAVGEVPDARGGRQPVEVLLWQLTQKGRGADAGGEVKSAGVTLTFPYPLPLLGVYPDNPLWPPRVRDFSSSAGFQLFEGDAGAAAGPRFAGTTVVAADAPTVAALVTPEVLGLPQLSGRHWRLDGRTAVAWSKGHQSPETLAEAVTDLCALVAGVPQELLDTAAESARAGGGGGAGEAP